MSAPRVGTARMGDDGRVEVSFHRLRGVINDSRGRMDLAADIKLPDWPDSRFERRDDTRDPERFPRLVEPAPVVDAALIDGGAES